MPRRILVALPSGAPGEYVLVTDGNVAASVPALNFCTYMPFDIIRPLSIDQIISEVTTIGAAGAVVRAGIYNDDGTNNNPGSLLIDAGTVEADATTGLKVFPAVLTLSPGRYWGVVVPQVATSTQRLAFSTATRVAIPNISNLNVFYKTVGGISGALPATATAPTSPATSAAAMAFRLA